MQLTKYLKMGCVMGCVLLLCGCEIKENPPVLENPVEMEQETTKVENRTISNIGILSAYWTPKIEEVSFPVDGTIETIEKTIGDRVEKNQILASLDEEEIQDQISQIESEIAYEKAALQYRIAINNSEAGIRQQLILNGNSNFGSITSQKEALEHPVSSNEIAKNQSEIKDCEQKQSALLEQISSATYEMGIYQCIRDNDSTLTNEKIKRSEKELSDLKREIKNKQIVAPCDGEIVAALDYQGNILQKDGFVQGYKSVYYIADKSEEYLVAQDLTDKEIETADSVYTMINGKKYQLQSVPYSVDEVKLANQRKETVPPRFHAQVGTLNPETLETDQCNIYLENDKKENVLCVQNSAVFYDGAQPYLVVCQADETQKIEVEVGVKTDLYTEILSGVAAGDEVLLNGGFLLSQESEQIQLEKGNFQQTEELIHFSVKYPVSQKVTINQSKARIGKLMVAEGDAIKKGDQIAELSVYKVNSKITQLTYQIETLKSEFSEKKKEMEHQIAILKVAPATTDGEKWLAKLQATLWTQQIEQLGLETDYQISLKTKEIEKIQKENEETSVAAQMDGVIRTPISVEGSKAITCEDTICLLENREQALLYVADKKALHYGMQVTISGTMDGAQKEYKGHVVSAYNVLPESIYEESKEFEGCAVIKAEGLKGEELLKMTNTKISYQSKAAEDVFLVDESALFRDNYGYFLYISTEQGTKKNYITIGGVHGNQDGDKAWISGGVDQIITVFSKKE